MQPSPPNDFLKSFFVKLIQFLAAMDFIGLIIIKTDNDVLSNPVWRICSFLFQLQLTALVMAVVAGIAFLFIRHQISVSQQQEAEVRAEEIRKYKILEKKQYEESFRQRQAELAKEKAEEILKKTLTAKKPEATKDVTPVKERAILQIIGKRRE